MADSQIEAIFDAVANLSVTVDSTAVTGRTLAESSTVVNVTPVRIISPLSDKNEARQAVQFTLGNQFSVDWTLTDLLLFRDTRDGTGFEYDMAHLVDYLGAYIDVIRVNRKLGLSQVTITSVDIEVGVYEYPANGGKYYHGCKGTLKIKELIS